MIPEDLFIAYCVSCGEKYKVIKNEAYGKDPQALLYINEDDKGRYYSNKLLHRCPSCVISRRGAD